MWINEWEDGDSAKKAQDKKRREYHNPKIICRELEPEDAAPPDNATLVIFEVSSKGNASLDGVYTVLESEKNRRNNFVYLEPIRDISMLQAIKAGQREWTSAAVKAWRRTGKEGWEGKLRDFAKFFL